MSEDSPGPNKFARYAELSQIGLEMVAPIGAGILLDYWRGWGPWGAIIGAVLGLVGGMGHLISILNTKAAQDLSKKRREKP
jgi:F0F1-type ATP synthase assembly protein I